MIFCFQVDSTERDKRSDDSKRNKARKPKANNATRTATTTGERRGHSITRAASSGANRTNRAGNDGSTISATLLRSPTISKSRLEQTAAHNGCQNGAKTCPNHIAACYARTNY
jgi:hypothetical protein